MDWASHYRAERAAPGARTTIAEALVPDTAVADAVERGDVLSFPHTSLRDAVPLQGRVVRALYDLRSVERVVALGVLHAGGIDIYREALSDATPVDRRKAAFAQVRGAFVRVGDSIETSFGDLPTWRGGEDGDILREDRHGLLSGEFSLDTFHSVLRVAADVLGKRPLPTWSVYMGMTRDPMTGSLATAVGLAERLRAHVDASTALVATGDLVHYGTAYGGAWLDGEPLSREARRRILRSEVSDVLLTAFENGDAQAAYRRSRDRLGNDQREMLAVLSAYLGEGASSSVLSFDLSDYSGILGVAPPCDVASALVAYRAASPLQMHGRFRTLVP